MIHPDLFQEITGLSDLLRAKFSPPEFIPGCEVMSVTDKSLYATNNGWIEAICGQHNQQRVRWKSNETVIVGDFIDVLYFPDRRLFEAYGLGGAAAVPGAGGWPYANVLTVSTTDADAAHATIAAAIAAASDGDVILLDAETFSLSTTITVDKALTITSLGQTVITSSVAGPTLELTDAAGATLSNLTIRNTGAGAKSGCVKWAVDDVIIRDCLLEKLSGASTVSYCIYQLGGSGHLIDTNAECTDPPGDNYAYLNDTADASITLTRGNFQGLTSEVFTARAGSNLIGEFFSANDVSWAGTSSGWYFKAGNLMPFVGTGRVLGVWLEDISTSYRTYYSTLTDAITASASGDIIHLEAGTYTGAFTLNKDVTLKGSAQGDTILALSATGTTLAISTAGAIVEDLTVTNTRASSTNKAIAITANCRLRNVIAASTGAATTNYGIDVSAATVDLIGCEASASGATNKIALNLVSSAVVNVYEGVLNGVTADASVDTSTLNLFDPVMVNKAFTDAGTIRGWYFDATGHRYAYGLSRLIWTPPSFRVHKNGTNQTGIVAGVSTKLTWSTEDWDTHGWFANDKFTPQLAGKYLFEGRAYFTATADGELLYYLLYKNGAVFDHWLITSSSVNPLAPGGSAIATANGTTDYFEAYCNHGTVPNRDVNGASFVTHFAGVYLGK